MLAARYLSVKILAILRSLVIPSVSCPYCICHLVPNSLRSALRLLQVTRAPLSASVPFRVTDARDLVDLTHSENLHNVKPLPGFTILLRKCFASSAKHYHSPEAPQGFSFTSDDYRREIH